MRTSGIGVTATTTPLTQKFYVLRYAALAPKGRLKLASPIAYRGWTIGRAAEQFRLAHSSVGGVLRLYKMPLLRHPDQNTDLAARRPVAAPLRT